MIRKRRIAVRVFIAASLLLLYFASTAQASDALIPREHHEWGRFPVGSWKKARLVTEKLNTKGEVVSRDSSETTTTVVGVTDDSVQLQLETVVEVAGKQFNKEPHVVTQGFGGEVKTDAEQIDRQVTNVGKDSVVIDGRTVESEVKTIVVRRPSCRWTSRIHYSQEVAPYVLRREISAHDPDGRTGWYRTTVQVTALNMPHEVLGEICPTSHVRTVHTTNRGKTITLEVRCEDVPGGFVSHSSKQFDERGRLVGRSTLELVDYHVPGEPPEEADNAAGGPSSRLRWPQRRWRR